MSNRISVTPEKLMETLNCYLKKRLGRDSLYVNRIGRLAETEADGCNWEVEVVGYGGRRRDDQTVRDLLEAAHPLVMEIREKYDLLPRVPVSTPRP